MRKKIVIIFAISSAILAFCASQPSIVKSFAKATFIFFPERQIAIDYITQPYNVYRSPNKELRYIKPLNIFYLDNSDPGFKFIKKMLQRIYYKKLNDNILLFFQFQDKHEYDDPENPQTTSRPIFYLFDFKKLQSNDRIEVEKHKKHITDEKSLLVAIDDNYRTTLLLWSTLLIVLSVIFSMNKISALEINSPVYEKEDSKKAGVPKMKRQISPTHIYSTITNAIASTELATWNRFSSFLMCNSILILAWVALFGHSQQLEMRTFILVILSLIGCITSLFWAANGYRGRSSLREYIRLAQAIENNCEIWPEQINKTFEHIENYICKLRFQPARAQCLLVAIPISFASLYIILFFVSIY